MFFLSFLLVFHNINLGFQILSKHNEIEKNISIEWLMWRFWWLTCEKEFKRFLSFFLWHQSMTRRHFRVWCVCYSLLFCFLPMLLAYLKTEKEIYKYKNKYIIFRTYIYLRTKLIYNSQDIQSYTSTGINMKIFNMLQRFNFHFVTLYNDFHLYVYKHFLP